MHYIIPLKIMYVLVLIICILNNNTCAFGWFGEDLNGAPCYGKGQGYGPFDYTNPIVRKKYLPIVEQYHFSQDVERLQKGQSGSVSGDLDYVLRAFPNHHRALYAVIRLQLKYKFKLKTPPECYLIRASAFQPKDAEVHNIYGIYLYRLRKYLMAQKEYQNALSLRPESIESNYNYGLVLFKLKEYKESAIYAHKAYSLGYPLMFLRNKLSKLGYW